MAIYGYIKHNYPYSTVEQFNQLSTYECGEILVEYELSTHSKILDKLLDKLCLSDQLVICDLRTFFTSIKSLKDIFEVLEEKQIQLISINDEIDTQKTPTFYSDLIKVFIADEKHRSHIVKVSIEKARAEGRIGGRPKIDSELIETITIMHKKERKTIREIAELCNVSIGTVHKYINK